MKMVAEHSAPIHPGEDILEHPKGDDPRVIPWLEELKRLGVIDKDGIMIKKATLLRGVGPEGYLWRMEWEEPDPVTTPI